MDRPKWCVEGQNHLSASAARSAAAQVVRQRLTDLEMRTQLAFEPERTTAEAFADFATSIGHPPRPAERAVDGVAPSPTESVPAPGAGRG